MALSEGLTAGHCLHLTIHNARLTRTYEHHMHFAMQIAAFFDAREKGNHPHTLRGCLTSDASWATAQEGDIGITIILYVGRLSLQL